MASPGVITGEVGSVGEGLRSVPDRCSSSDPEIVLMETLTVFRSLGVSVVLFDVVTLGE